MTTGRGNIQVIYLMRIACPKCSMQQTFRGTPPQIGDAVETWNSGHQLTAHAEAVGAVTGPSERQSRPGGYDQNSSNA
jgi:hypothetical protein